MQTQVARNKRAKRKECPK